MTFSVFFTASAARLEKLSMNFSFNFQKIVTFLVAEKSLKTLLNLCVMQAQGIKPSIL